MSEDENVQTSLDAFDAPPRALNLPSQTPEKEIVQDNSTVYHDLELLNPNAPVAETPDGMVLHQATLHDVTGLPTLFDWAADGDAAIIQMEKLMGRDVELQTALEQLTKFVEGDIGGQIIRLTDTRLMLLPPGCRGVRGVETESFAAESDEL
tara:strand:+ start:121 stop:576 length:456 start_codon:yes stop_codon:yes gene_type:complete